MRDMLVEVLVGLEGDVDVDDVGVEDVLFTKLSEKQLR